MGQDVVVGMLEIMRGNAPPGAGLIVPTLCVVMPQGTLCVQ
jgi:hypothetical protein